jgi:tetratricopeptide (TPR) repeat protein
MDLGTLWDFKQPALSEQRFREALAVASPDDALVLQTQIARSFGLRREFERARELLVSLDGQLATASAEAKARHALEWGRSFASATHPPEMLTAPARQQAREAFERATAIARAAGLDDLAIDALHMQAFVDTAPADQLRWAEAALSVAEVSTQPAARRWRASLRNNAGYALHQLGRHEEALVHFRRAVVLREEAGDAPALRVAHWMVAWTLRSLGRLDEALALQLQLERECDAAAAPDPYVFEELEAIYRALGDPAKAEHYARRHKAG